GHYVKMVHNGVEYGLMQAYAEGFNVFEKCEYELDNAKIAHLWGQGSVVRSWLLELAARAFEEDGNDLQSIEGYTEDSGEGRWTIADARGHGGPAHPPPAAGEPAHRRPGAPAGPADLDGDLRRDGRSRAPQTAACDLQPRARRRAAGAVLPDRRRAQRKRPRGLPPGVRRS